MTELVGPRPSSPADRLLVVFSDIEMGAGGNLDDFPHSDVLGEMIVRYNQGEHAKLPVDLVFNGDTFDLLKTSYLESHPRHVTSDVALGKMARVAAAHPRFFEALRAFLDHRDAPRKIWFVTGNHDFELLFPQVQNFIRSLCGGSELVEFPGFSLDLGRVHIEHGNQADALFYMKPTAPFVEHDGKVLLNLPWANVALLDVIMPLIPLLHFHERLVPRKTVMELMPDVRELVVEAFWKYWTRDYWKGFFRSRDPMKRVNWTMFKEVSSRFVSKDADVSIGRAYIDRMRQDDRFDLYLVGHVHEARTWTYGHRKIIQTGCMRNEYMVLQDGKALHPINKTYAEVFMQGDEVLYSHMLEVPSPTPPEGYVPADIFEVLPQVRALLAPPDEQTALHKERQKLEEDEAKSQAKDEGQTRRAS